MSIKVKVDGRRARNKVETIQRNASVPEINQIVHGVAEWGRSQLVMKTPKKWTGQTRRSWRTQKTKRGYNILNPSKVMHFLEVGTKAHGPKTAKFLYIPLTRKASFGWNDKLKIGTDYILKKRVRGIKAMKIVEKLRPEIQGLLKDQMASYIRRIIQS